MKKLFYLISMIALMGSVVSCDKLNDANTSVDGLTTLKISASVPQTKTFINGGLVKWSTSDVITALAPGVAAASVAVPEPEEGQDFLDKFDFTVPEWPETAVPQYAVYSGPGDGTYATYAPVLEDGKINMTLRYDQEIFNTASFGKKVNISVGELVSKDEMYETVLKNVGGLIKFSLKTAATKVEIKDINEKPMAGNILVEMENGEPKVVKVLNGKKYVEVKSRRDKVGDIYTLKAGGTFFACVLPGEYTPQITVTPLEGEPFTLTANSPVTINRSEYVDFGTLTDPDNTLTITVDFTTQPFTTNLPNNKAPITNTIQEFILDDGGEERCFGIRSASSAYYTSQSLRLTTDNSYGYILLPGIPGFALTEYEVTGAQSKEKTYRLFKEDPINNASAVEIASVANLTTDKKGSAKVPEAEIEYGARYYIGANSSNAAIRKLVLTYEK